MRAFPFPREEEPMPLVPGQVVVRLRLIGQNGSVDSYK